MTNPHDRRSRRTRKALRLALLELLGEHAEEVITIREVAERADVAYTTFFRHYDSREALMADLVRPEIEPLTLFGARLADAGQRVEAARDLAVHVSAHRNVWRPLLAQRSSAVIGATLREGIVARAAFALEGVRHLPVDLAAAVFATTTVEVLNWWLSSPQPVSADDFAVILCRAVDPLLS